MSVLKLKSKKRKVHEQLRSLEIPAQFVLYQNSLNVGQYFLTIYEILIPDNI